jgi:Sep-tRNA:Cys-tRNA synthetase
VLHWEHEVENANRVVEALCAIEGTRAESDMPREHTLTRINTMDSFDPVAKTHKKKGFFLSQSLKKKGVIGVIPGSTRVWKYNTYGLNDAQITHVCQAFQEIAQENGLTVH